MSFSAIDFMYGVALAAICFFGLMLGVKLMFHSQQIKDNKQKSRTYAMFAVFVLLGQFLGAGYFVFEIRTKLADPLSFGLGLIGSILLASIVSRFFQKS